MRGDAILPWWQFYLPPNIFGLTIWDVHTVSFLGLAILRWTLDFWENCVPLVLNSQMNYFSTYWQEGTNLMQQLWYVIKNYLYMFRAPICPSVHNTTTYTPPPTHPHQAHTTITVTIHSVPHATSAFPPTPENRTHIMWHLNPIHPKLATTQHDVQHRIRPDIKA